MAKKEDTSGGNYSYQERGGKRYNFNVAAPVKKKVAAAASKPPVPVPTPRPNGLGIPDVVTTGGAKGDFGDMTSGIPPVVVNRGSKGSLLPVTPYTPTMEDNMGNPVAEDRPPLYKDGGRVRGDGVARVKTKGRTI